MKHIELINSVSQTVASGGKLTLGNVNIKYCNGAFSYNGVDTLTLVHPGTYQLLVKIDLTGTVAGQLVSYAISHDGLVSTIVNASDVVAATTDITTLVIPKMVKICNSPIEISIVNNGTDSTIYTNLIIDIVKVA